MVHIPPRLRVSVFFVYFVFFVVPLPYFVVPFVVHTLPPSFYFRAFRVFRGSTPVFRGSIRGSYSLPPSFFFVPFVFFVVPPLYFVVPFVSIRVHSWFILSPLPSFFVFFVVPFVSIRVHSWFLLSPRLFFVFFVFFVVLTPVFRGSIRGSELWRRGLSSLPAAGFASSLSGYINRVWTETGGRSDYFGEESPDTTGQEARLKDRVSRGKPAVRIAQQRRDRRHFVSARVKKAG